MKLLLSFVLVLLAFTVGSFAADCELDGRKSNEGEIYTPPGDCKQVKCLGNGITWTLHCVVRNIIPRGCDVVLGDNTKPFPLCCAEVKC